MNHLNDFLRAGFGDITDQLLRLPQDGGDVNGKCTVFVCEGGSVEEPTPVPVRYTWCIDAGHGKQTKGKRSPLFPVNILSEQPRLLEWEFDRDVAERVIEQLAAFGRSYMRTMPVHGNYGNALTQRVRNANNYATDLPKLFLSIHGNAGPARSINHYADDTVKGIETWHAFSSTKGREMAAVFQRHLIHETGLKNRSLRSKEVGEFYVLRATRMPAILTENGFFNSRHDLPLMATEAFRQSIADAHVAAIMEIEKNGL
jgi:N-acetylmuramoyl-L-alanine amidase